MSKLRRGRTRWQATVPPGTLERIESAVRAGRENAAQVFRRFNLQRLGIKPATFRRWFGIERRKLRDRTVPAEPRPSSAGSSPPDYEEIQRSAFESIQAALDAGGVKLYELNDTVRMLVALGHLRLDQKEDQRDEVKFNLWYEAKMEEAAEELETVAIAKQLTPEQVAEIRVKVLGL